MSAAEPPPARVDEAPAQRVRERRWWPALAVTGLILALLGSSQLVRGPMPTAPPVRVGEVVVQPRPGWAAVTETPTFARLQRGPATLDIVATTPTYTGAVGVAASYVDQVLRPTLAQLTLGEAGDHHDRGRRPGRPRPLRRRHARRGHDPRRARRRQRPARRGRVRRGRARGDARGRRRGRRCDDRPGGDRPVTRRDVLHNRSIFQPREPAFWIFVAFLGYGAIRMSRHADRSVIDLAVRMGAVVDPARPLRGCPLFLLIYYLDLYEREPLVGRDRARSSGARSRQPRSRCPRVGGTSCWCARSAPTQQPVGAGAHGAAHRGVSEGRGDRPALPDRAR